MTVREKTRLALFFTRLAVKEKALANLHVSPLVAELFRREWTTSATVYLPGGNPPVPGRLFRNPALAATYRRVLQEAEAGGGDRGRDNRGDRGHWDCRKSDCGLDRRARPARRRLEITQSRYRTSC